MSDRDLREYISGKSSMKIGDGILPSQVLCRCGHTLFEHFRFDVQGVLPTALRDCADHVCDCEKFVSKVDGVEWQKYLERLKEEHDAP